MKTKALLLLPVLVLSGCFTVGDGAGTTSFDPVLAVVMAGDKVLPQHTAPRWYPTPEKSIPPMPEKPPEPTTRPAQPGQEFVWVEGAYNWDGKYEWESGHWEKPPRLAHYVPAHWEEHNGAYLFCFRYWK